MSSSSLQPKSHSSNRWFLAIYWLLLALMVVLPGGIGLWAFIYLLGLPDLPACQRNTQAYDLTSDRLYCAEMIANGQSAENLLEAIQLVNAIPAEDPLRSEGDRLARSWSEQLMQLAEIEFQEGNLEGAIDLLQRIPLTIQSYQTTNQHIEQWQATWDKAELIHEDARAAIEGEDWYAVMTMARKLLLLGNRYWATVKYQELMADMQTAKESRQPAKPATSSPGPGSTQDWLKQWEQEQERDNIAYLKRAQELAKRETVEGLSGAIDVAYQVLYGTPHYDHAQHLIANWQRQIELLEDRPYLERAIALAAQGDQHSLEAAIEEARQIHWGRPLYDEVSDRIEQWNAQLQDLQLQTELEQLDDLTDSNPGSEELNGDRLPGSSPAPDARNVNLPTYSNY